MSNPISSANTKIWTSGSSSQPEWRFAQGTLELSSSLLYNLTYARIEFEYTESNFNVKKIFLFIKINK